MSEFLYLKPEAIVAWLFYQTMLQQQIIELQQKVIELQQRIDKMTPPTPPDEEVFWHISSGLMSDEAANSDSAKVVRRFRKWNIDFANKHIKPYVNPKVYSECLNQMTRGLSERITELEAEQEAEEEIRVVKKASSKKSRNKRDKATQLVLIQ
jgi:hypothetical protein